MTVYKKLPLAVIDTNVFLSSLISDGPCRKIIQELDKNHFQLITTEPIINELLGVGKRNKFRKYFTLHDFNILIWNLRQKSKIIKNLKPVLDKYKSPDPKDNIFIQCAIYGKADCLVTGNPKHFTNLSNKIPVLSPYQFLTKLKTSK